MSSPKQPDDRAEIELAEELWVQLLRVYRRMLRAGSAMTQPFGITPAQYALLNSLETRGVLTQQMLADESLVSKGQISQTISVLERDGLIEKISEGNVNRPVLTNKAVALLSELVPLHEQLSRSVMAILSPADQQMLLGMLRRIEMNLAQMSAEHPGNPDSLPQNA